MPPDTEDMGDEEPRKGYAAHQKDTVRLFMIIGKMDKIKGVI